MSLNRPSKVFANTQKIHLSISEKHNAIYIYTYIYIYIYNIIYTYAALAKKQQAVLEQKLIDNVEEAEKIVNAVAPEAEEEDDEVSSVHAA